MGVRIYKKLSKSTGTRRLESLFWFEKSSYEEYIAICDFSEVFAEGSVIDAIVAAAFNVLGADVTDEIIESSEIVAKDRSVKVILQAGTVGLSPYTMIVRALTEDSEQSELEFEMRISFNSVSISSLDTPFEDLDTPFEDLDETF